MDNSNNHSNGCEDAESVPASREETNKCKHDVSATISKMMDTSEDDETRETLDEMTENGIMIKRHLCNVCQESFSRLGDLKKHVTVHTGLKAYRCDMCDKGYSQPSSLFTHKKVHRVPDIAVCEICFRKFSGPSSLKKHRLSHLAKRRHPCLLCDKSFAYPSGLREHEMCHLRLQSAKETDDNETEISNRDESNSVENGGDSLEPESNKNASMSSFPARDKRLPSNYPCTLCSSSFVYSRQLARHMRVHNVNSKTGVWLCKVCGKMPANQKSYASHMLMHKGVKPYSCEQCGTDYAQLNSLKIHMLTHTGKVPYTCDECGKTFLIRNFLKEHQRLHTGEKPYVCEDCSRAFRTAKLLRKHRVLHTREYESQATPAVNDSGSNDGPSTTNPVWIAGKEMWKCFVCGKAYKYPSYLDRHKFVHEDSQKYVCEPCGRTFNSLMAYRGHQAKHRGDDQETTCTVCGRKFASSRSLSSHMRAHEPVEEWYSCGVCQKSFHDSDQLVGHMQEHDETGVLS